MRFIPEQKGVTGKQAANCTSTGTTNWNLCSIRCVSMTICKVLISKILSLINLVLIMSDFHPRGFSITGENTTITSLEWD